ncbi:NAD(P)H-dependent oxidoreductase subunit E [Candidatus Proelusimicrobium volucris]|uniref:NADH-quinone oxidoreductase subunit NuoE family protein n=1 Tax=Candidatus Proelusimicrobium volucris TaxID=3416225 RepID=UPI003D0EB80A
MSQETTAAAELRAIINKWKDVEGSLVMMLHSVQDKLGYVPRETAMVISKETGIPLAKIYEVLTFYHFFKLNPPAKCQIAVCTGTACYLKGAPELLKEIEKCTGVKEGESSPDGKYSVAGLRCIGCCGLSPVISINGKIHGQVKPSQIKAILAEAEKAEVSHE